MNYKPVILLGNGVRGNQKLVDYLTTKNIPMLTTWMAADLIPEDHPSFCGRPGIFGQRAANIIQQKATNFYAIGARLDGEQVAYAYDRFCPNAVQKMVFDCDKAELEKFDKTWDKSPANTSDVEVLDFKAADPEWLAWCKALYNRFRPELDGEDGGKFVNPFAFLTLLHEHSKNDDVFAIGSSGNAPCTFYQSYKVKEGQRISNVSTIGSMGADIPMALGAALATGRRTICVTGDGGFQMNTQELETIRRLYLPITFFVMNNGGYNSIRVGQLARFGRVTGANVATGLTLPRLEDTAELYRFMYKKLDGKNLDEFGKCFTEGPTIVEVMVDPEWEQLPRVKATTPKDGNLKNLRTDNMEDMSPKIDDLERIMNE